MLCLVAQLCLTLSDPMDTHTHTHTHTLRERKRLIAVAPSMFVISSDTKSGNLRLLEEA